MLASVLVQNDWLGTSFHPFECNAKFVSGLLNNKRHSCRHQELLKSDQILLFKRYSTAHKVFGIRFD